MVVGSGLLARAFYKRFKNNSNVCVYASGVANSCCTDSKEFLREHEMLRTALASKNVESVFIYFSTCSVYDSEQREEAYVRHKLAMERLVGESDNYLILRLPQAVGESPNPHTLLNYIYNKIIRKECIDVWSRAERNVIDVDDIEKISFKLIESNDCRNTIVNIANPCNYTIREIIGAFERVLREKAICAEQEKGGSYRIDIRIMLQIIQREIEIFDDMYLDNIIEKYYGR